VLPAATSSLIQPLPSLGRPLSTLDQARKLEKTHPIEGKEHGIGGRREEAGIGDERRQRIGEEREAADPYLADHGRR
jgi:hypothetical protein